MLKKLHYKRLEKKITSTVYCLIHRNKGDICMKTAVDECTMKLKLCYISWYIKLQ